METRIWEMKGGLESQASVVTALYMSRDKDHGAVRTGRHHASQMCGGAWSLSSPVCRSRNPNFTAPPQSHFPDLFSLLSCLRSVLHSLLKYGGIWEGSKVKVVLGIPEALG